MHDLRRQAVGRQTMAGKLGGRGSCALGRSAVFVCVCACVSVCWCAHSAHTPRACMHVLRRIFCAFYPVVRVCVFVYVAAACLVTRQPQRRPRARVFCVFSLGVCVLCAVGFLWRACVCRKVYNMVDGHTDPHRRIFIVLYRRQCVL